MNPVTLIMAYYDNPEMLRIQIQDWHAMGTRLRDMTHLVVVDDGSPRWPAKNVVRPESGLRVYRVGVDVPWNQDACRNIGVRHAETDWLLLTDMDHRIPFTTWKVLLNVNWNPEHAYYFKRVSAPDMEPYKPHPNTWFLHKNLYERVGGYDERFAGLYGTDGDFKVRLNRAAKKLAQIDAEIIRVGREVVPDASTTTYQRKPPGDSDTIKSMVKKRDKYNLGIQRYRFPYERVA